jgi:branched-chain amino acid aminotransferase
MDHLIYHNDRIVDVSEAKVAPTLAGLIYGWGVFTNLRIYAGRAFAFDMHWERLQRHADKARVPVPLDVDTAKRALQELITANQVGQGRARLTLLKGDAGSWRSATARDTDVLMFTIAETPRPTIELALTLSPYRLLSTNPFVGIKRTAMMENLLAFDEARGRSFDEAVMLNERGEMVSATAANLFWVRGDELFTPSRATGCIAGITRRFVQEIVASRHLHLVEGSFTIQRLLEAREIFLTSTAREVAIVTAFDMKQYDLKEARIAKMIRREFQELTRDAKMLT